MANEIVKDDKEEISVNLDELFPKPEEDSVSKDTKTTDAKTDVKEDPSSGKAEKAETKDEAASLEAQIEGLTKELSRVRRDRNASEESVEALRSQLAHVQGQLEALARRDAASAPANKLARYSDEQLVHGQTEWEEELLESRASLRKAREEGNEAAIERQERAVAVARATLNAIRTELLERTKRVGAEQAKVQGEANRIVQDVVAIYDQAYEVWPDLKDKNSDIWRAGNDAYNEHAAIMKQLGPFGELVAVSIAVAKNPELVGGGSKKAATARKELLSEINDKVEKSLIKGGGKTKVKGTPDFDLMPATDFDAVINKIKLG